MLTSRFSTDSLDHESEGLSDLDFSHTMIFTADEDIPTFMDDSNPAETSARHSLTPPDQDQADADVDVDMPRDNTDNLRDRKGKGVPARISVASSLFTRTHEPYERVSPETPVAMSYPSPIASSSSSSRPLQSSSVFNPSPQYPSFLSKLTNELTQGDSPSFHTGPYSDNLDRTAKNKGKGKADNMDFGSGDHVLWGLGIPVAPPTLPNLNFSPSDVHYPLDWDNDYNSSYVEPGSYAQSYVSYPNSVSERTSSAFSPLSSPLTDAFSSPSSPTQPFVYSPVATSSSMPNDLATITSIVTPVEASTSAPTPTVMPTTDDLSAGCVPWLMDKKSIASKIKKRSRSLLTLRVDVTPSASTPPTSCPSPSTPEPSASVSRRPKFGHHHASYPHYHNPISVPPPRTVAPEISLEPEIVLLNHFDNRLPRELKLAIFSTLVELHEIEQARDIAEGRWTMAKAEKSKWVGRDAGLRELVKISRVRSSRPLVSKGQETDDTLAR